jgi:hypothetical protein
MATKAKTLADHPHVDQRGLDWQAAAAKGWEKSGHDLTWWEDAPERELPDFNADTPEHVKREHLGGYLSDGATVHRVATATPDCKLDAIEPALYVHFWHEVVEGFPDLTPCPECLPA